MSALSQFFSKTWASLPTFVANFLAQVASFVIGLLVAFALHYVLYRIGLPSKAFIYVAF